MSRAPTPTDRYVSVGWRSFFRTPAGQLVLAMMAIEALAAMQLFGTVTVLPAVAADLDGRRWYGAVISVSSIASFLTIPCGAPILQRLGASRTMGLLSPLYVAGSAVSALAPSMELFVVGRLLQGLAAGALATVALGAVMHVVSDEWRSRVLALTSAMWIVPALVGPALAGALAEGPGWRWSIGVLIIPMIALRWWVALLLRGDTANKEQERAPIPVFASITLAVAMGLTVAASTGTGIGLLVGFAGTALAVAAGVRLLPPGVATARRGRHAAIAALLVLSAVYYGGDDIATIVIVDRLGGSVFIGGLALTGGAVAWAVTSLLQARSRRTARDIRAVQAGGVTLAIAFAALSTLTAIGPGTLAPFAACVSWLVGGIGMGLAYPVLLDEIFADRADASPIAGIAGAVVLAEALGGGLGGAVTGSAITVDTAHGGSGVISTAIFAALAALALTLVVLARRRDNPISTD